MNKKLRVFEAFSGIGSQRKALENIGVNHEVVAISEIDKYALKSYEAIHGDCPNIGDISKLNIEGIPDHDLFTYSFPCQNISVAGKQEGIIRGETRSGLLYECERVIENKRPKYLLMENVKNLVGKKFKPQFDEWLSWLKSQGYTNYWKVLNTKDFKIPQNRERVFVVSILGEHKPYEFPKGYKLELRLKDVLEEAVDEKYYINKKWHISTEKDLKHDTNEIAQIDGVKFKSLRSITDINKICRCLDTMGGGQREPKIIDDMYKNRMNRIYEETCPTLRSERYGLKVEEDRRVRKITPKECWRLQAFSDEDFDKCVVAGLSNSQLYKQAGNSITVTVLEEIFKELLKDYID